METIAAAERDSNKQQRPAAGFWITVAVLWVALVITARFYSFPQGIAAPALAAFVAALGLELTLYTGTGFASVRRTLAALGRPATIAAALAISAVVPWLAFSIGAGGWSFQSSAILLGLILIASFWYVFLPANDLVDAAYLCLIAGVTLSHLISDAYPVLAPKFPADILGRLMWVRLGILAIVLLRRAPDRFIGFLPNAREWKIGTLCYLGFLPLGLIFGSAAGFDKLRDNAFTPLALGKAGLTFLGMLWVVAYGEEFFFRGMLQPMVGRWLRSDIAGLLATSVLFGLAHLGFRGFPNWNFVALAAVAGLFYGTAFMRTGSVRAAMVAHALVNVTWRSFLSG
jgi:uncharacterized protein